MLRSVHKTVYINIKRPATTTSVAYRLKTPIRIDIDVYVYLVGTNCCTAYFRCSCVQTYDASIKQENDLNTIITLIFTYLCTCSERYFLFFVDCQRIYLRNGAY